MTLLYIRSIIVCIYVIMYVCNVLYIYICIYIYTYNVGPPSYKLVYKPHEL